MPTLPQRPWGARVWRYYLFVLLGCWMGAPCLGVRQTDPGAAFVVDDQVEVDEVAGYSAADAAVDSMMETSADGVAAQGSGFFTRRRRSVHFDVAEVGANFLTISQDTPEMMPCRGVLGAKAYFDRDTFLRWKDDTNFRDQDLLMKGVNGDPTLTTGGQWLYAVGSRWGANLSTPAGAMPVKPGMRLVKVGEEAMNEGTWSEILILVGDQQWDHNVTLTFQAGFDLRGCWKDMVDDKNEAVCGDTALQALGTDLRTNGQDLNFLVEKYSDQIIDDFSSFKLRTMTESKASLLWNSILVLHAGELDDDNGCYQTALAPICLVLQIPRNCPNPADCEAMPDIFWVVQRKVDLTTQTKRPVRLGSDSIDAVRLIGPKLLNPANSIGQWIGRRQQWRREDAGFVRMFQYGLHWFGCGARQAARTLQKDAMRLKDLDMTSYRLESKFYTTPNETECRCAAMEGKRMWPLIVDACPGVSEGTFLTADTCAEPMRFAFSIDDWLEKDVERLNPISTKRGAETYRQWWVRMWPQYFHLEPRSYDAANERIERVGIQPAEKLQKDDKIVAIMKIKWNNQWWCGDACATTEWFPGEDEDQPKHNFWRSQITQVSSRFTESGSSQKVIAGTKGKVVAIPFPVFADDANQEPDYTAVGVEWDPPLNGVIYKVYLSQVMRDPRVVEAITTTTTPIVSDVTTTSFDFWDDRTGSSGPQLIVFILAAFSVIGIPHWG